jgi:peptidoglycan/LPS O-acetylase OafA/YrhL
MVGAAFLYGTVYFPWNPISFFPPGNWVLWSLGVEIWFSVLFPVLVCWLHKLGWRVFLPLVVIAAFGARYLGYWHNPPMPGVILNFVSDSVIGRLDDFVMGMLAAHVFAQRRAQFQSVWWLPVSGVLVALGATLWWYWANKLIPQTTASLCGPLLNVGIFLGFSHLLTVPHGSSRLSAMLSARWLQLLGIMCYSVYCWHGIILLKLKPSYMNGVAEYLTYLGITLVLSWFTFRFIEFGHIKKWQDLIPGGLPNGRWYRVPATARITK